MNLQRKRAEQKVVMLQEKIKLKKTKGLKTDADEVSLILAQQAVDMIDEVDKDIQALEEEKEKKLSLMHPIERAIIRDPKSFNQVMEISNYELAAQAVIDHMGIKMINDIIINKDNSVLKKEQLQSSVAKLLGNASPKIWKDLSDSVAAHIENKHIDINKDEIVCKNGKYNVNTGVFTPGKFESVNTIPWDYSPTSASPLGEELMRRFTGSNIGFDTQVFEAVGLLMAQSKGYHFKTSIFADGDSNFGKSTLVEEIIMPTIGKDNYSIIDFSNLDSQEIASMINKTAVFDPDMTKAKMNSTAIASFKRVTGDSELQAKILYKDRFKFTNYSTAWINCNGLPRIVDRGSGGSVENRIHVIKFTVDVKNKYPDPRIGDKITANRKNICEWFLKESLHALHAALKRNKLTKTIESEKAIAMLSEQDPVVKFIKISLIKILKDAAKPIDTTTIYRNYVATHGGDQLYNDAEMLYNYGAPAVGRNSFIDSIKDNASKYGYKIYQSGGYWKVKLDDESDANEMIDPYGDGNLILKKDFDKIMESMAEQAILREEDEKERIQNETTI